MNDFDPVDSVKTVLIAAIAKRLHTKYPTQSEAAADLKFDQGVISRLCAGKTQRFSLAWLVTLANKLGADISIKVS